LLPLLEKKINYKRLQWNRILEKKQNGKKHELFSQIVRKGVIVDSDD
jgi:hypothetical protein